MPLGLIDYALFLPPGMLSSNRSFKFPSQVLDRLPLAVLNGSSEIRQALEEEAQKRKIKLEIRLRFSSFPQLAQAVQTVKVAAIMPTLAAGSLTPGNFQMIRLPFLDGHSRRLSLVWNKPLAEVRPALATYSTVLANAFRQAAGKG